MYPKQFQCFTDDFSLFQATAKRSQDAGFDAPLIVCNQEHRFIAAEQLTAIGITPADIVLEPEPRNTGPAMIVAALWAEKHAPSSRLLFLPSDHIFDDSERFTTAVWQAAERMTDEDITLFGIPVDTPNTELGYIEIAGEQADDVVATVKSFSEKPAVAELEEMLRKGSFLWNTGIVLAESTTILTAANAVDPDTVAAVRSAFDEAETDLDFHRLSPGSFTKAASIAFDRLVLEKAANLKVVPMNLAWSDASSWQTIWQHGPRDSNGNLAHGHAILENTEDSLVISDDMLTVVQGIKNTAVIVSDDAILVTDLNEAKSLQSIVDRVAREDGEKHLLHRKVFRPWGSYRGLAIGERYQVKEIIVNPGSSLSLQKHFHRSEHWVVVQGTALVRCDDREMLLEENQSTYIPLGSVHRLENPGKIPTHLIEVQSGSYLGEDDIERLEDTYGRR